ncbi:hypothetical protein [Streptomyces sp. NBRC 109706]|uniref:hypothetical protein n=1 Tax=Streptomyces sp. NBRC 109706 TaxID=1550035 RepID=UPI000780ED8A|nr:hypothetical protein [Streptomyces sp. NBRC 109706]
MSTDTLDSDGQRPNQRTSTPEEQLLPEALVERIVQAVRLVGLPLAVETGGPGVYLDREGPIEGSVDHVVIRWHASNLLSDVAEKELPAGPAERLMSASLTAMEDALAELLAASGLVVAKHPFTRSLAVWGIDGPPPVEGGDEPTAHPHPLP